ncbi:MAG: hypothetical protein RJA70_827 [Pseudomonadota bacterium]|jgi:hypothetical protein
MRRRDWFLPLGLLLAAGRAQAFGQQGAFHARWLKTSGAEPLAAARESALGRWAWELVRRTSAPGRLVTSSVSADEPALLDEPFCVWAGSRDVGQLLGTELRRLREYFQLGGVLFVDDSDPVSGVFGRAARRELQRVLPEIPVVKLPTTHVVYKSYYLVERPVGRVSGPAELEGMVRGRQLQVLFSSHDLLGALARGAADEWTFPMDDPDPLARQQALRLAVNIAMYVLCSDYKDDQVHAEELMRRRGRQP